MLAFNCAKLQTKKLKRIKPRERFCQWYFFYSTTSVCLPRSVCTWNDFWKATLLRRKLCWHNKCGQSIKKGTASTNHKKCKKIRRSSQASGAKWGCDGLNQSQTYRTTTAQPWVSFTHWSEGSRGTQTWKFCSNSQ